MPSRLADIIRPQLRGTLVVVVPTADGAVVSADSRITFGIRFSDGHDKLVTVPSAPLSAAFITGNAAVPAHTVAPGEDLHAFIGSGGLLLDLRDVVRATLTAADAEISDLAFEAVADDCLEAVRRTAKAEARTLQGLRGRSFALVGAVTFDPQSRQTTRRAAEIMVDANGELSVRAWKASVFGLSDPILPECLGEGAYVASHVYEGPGCVHLTPASRSLLEQQPKVSTVGAGLGVAYAEDILRVASLMTETIPAVSGIGGETRTVVLR